MPQLFHKKWAFLKTKQRFVFQIFKKVWEARFTGIFRCTIISITQSKQKRKQRKKQGKIQTTDTTYNHHESMRNGQRPRQTNKAITILTMINTKILSRCQTNISMNFMMNKKKCISAFRFI